MIVDMSQPFQVVDAFTDRPFAGNPAAVCVMERAADEGWMRDVAREMNLSETAFLHPQTQHGQAGWGLRWLTPTIEVDLCGHATLASAHVLWETGRVPADDELRFFTRSGRLRAAPGPGGLILLDFPSMVSVECAPPDGLEAALGVRPGAIHFVGSNGMDYLVELESADAVRACRPDMARLAALPVRGTMITARAGGPESAGVDFVSRFFGPAGGVPEDPVTGSAHCALGPYWGARLGKTTLVGYQASARGGTVRVELRGDRVQLGGHAVTVSRGELLFPLALTPVGLTSPAWPASAPRNGCRPWSRR